MQDISEEMNLTYTQVCSNPFVAREWDSMINKENTIDYKKLYGDEMTKKLEEFTKYDDDKADLMLFPVEFIEEVVKVLEFGAKKYDRDNWRKCEDLLRYENAFLRHWTEYCKDPNSVDPDSGLPHLHHAACNIVFLLVKQKDISDKTLSNILMNELKGSDHNYYVGPL